MPECCYRASYVRFPLNAGGNDFLFFLFNAFSIININTKGIKRNT